MCLFWMVSCSIVFQIIGLKRSIIAEITESALIKGDMLASMMCRTRSLPSLTKEEVYDELSIWMSACNSIGYS